MACYKSHQLGHWVTFCPGDSRASSSNAKPSLIMVQQDWSSPLQPAHLSQVTITGLEPWMQLDIAGRSENFLVDPGVTYSVLTSYSGAFSSQTCTILGATGKTVIKRFTWALCCWDGQIFSHQFLVVPECPTPLLGKDLSLPLKSCSYCSPDRRCFKTLFLRQTIFTSHQVKQLLNGKGHLWMSDQRILRYQVVLMESPGLIISPCEILNPATLLPSPEDSLPFHSFLETLGHWTKPWEGLLEDPLTSPEEIWYTDGSSFVMDGKRRAGYVVVSYFETMEPKHLPPGTWAQFAELIALTWALELGKGKRVIIYTDSKYVFLMLHALAAIWKERGHLTTRGPPMKCGDQILRLLDAVHLPTEVSVSHCSVQFSRSVVSDSLRPHESHHARPPCPSPTPRVYSNSCPLTSDAIQPSRPLSSPSPPALNPSQHQGLFQWVNSSHEVAKVLEFQLQHQSFQWTPSIHPPKWLKWNKTKWNKTGKTNVDRM